MGSPGLGTYEVPAGAALVLGITSDKTLEFSVCVPSPGDPYPCAFSLKKTPDLSNPQRVAPGCPKPLSCSRRLSFPLGFARFVLPKL